MHSTGALWLILWRGRARWAGLAPAALALVIWAGVERPAVLIAETGGLVGVLFDLGVSSPQLDVAGRGFSFGKDGPLDMRMDPDTGESAAEWLARADEREIADVLFTLGEERQSRRIARAIASTLRSHPSISRSVGSTMTWSSPASPCCATTSCTGPAYARWWRASGLRRLGTARHQLPGPG